MLPEVENSPPPVTALINLTLAHCKTSIFSCANVTGFWRPRLDFLTSIVLKAPTVRGRVLVSTKKRQVKKVLWRSFTLLQKNPLSFATRCKNINSDWIACVIAELLSCGYLTAVFLIVPMFYANRRPANRTLPFGSFIPDKTAQITGACADLKPMMISEQISSLEIIWIDNHNNFFWVG